MLGTLVRGSVWMLCGSLMLVSSPDAVTDPPAKPVSAKAAKVVGTAERALKMREKLNAPINLEKGIDARTTLRDQRQASRRTGKQPS